MSEYEGLNAVYEDVVKPLVDAVNELNALLGEWRNEDGEIELGLALKDITERVTGSKSTSLLTLTYRLQLNTTRH